jgi:hypothetical protein
MTLLAILDWHQSAHSPIRTPTENHSARRLIHPQIGASLALTMIINAREKTQEIRRKIGAGREKSQVSKEPMALPS